MMSPMRRKGMLKVFERRLEIHRGTERPFELSLANMTVEIDSPDCTSPNL